MKIQSVSIDVPGGCPNNCKFCVSELTKESATGMLENKLKDIDDPWANMQYADRLEFLRDLGVNNVILTGTASEPVANMKFIEWFHRVNNSIASRFKHIELQTSGVLLNDKTLDELDTYGVKTISLSLSSLSSKLNNSISGIPEKLQFDIPQLCNKIKENGFNLRLSLNINKAGFPDLVYDKEDERLTKLTKLGIWQYFHKFVRLGADQVTFRKLYSDDSDSPQAAWIKQNDVPDHFWSILKKYIVDNGKPLQKLPFGAIKYSIFGLSTVIDDDCMAENNIEVLKYAILRRNCKIYSDWKDPASLIF